MRIFPVLLALCLWGFPVRAQEKTAIKFQSVTVRPGDTLWGIAQQYLKDPTRWNEILRHNKLPGSDPTIALPGMTLRVPMALIKEELRAAVLVDMVRQVLARRKASADWTDARLKMQLYRDDGLRTLADSSTRVLFYSGDILSLEQNSMAILKPMAKAAEGFDLELLRGSVVAGRSKTITISAKIIPLVRNTRYSADLRDDLTTHIEVYEGRAQVTGKNKTVEVASGFSTDVSLDGAPSPPIVITDIPRLAARIEQAGVVVRSVGAGVSAGPVGSVNVGGAAPGPVGAAADIGDSVRFSEDMKNFSIGIPVAAYRVQASDTQQFEQIVFDKNFDADERVNLNHVGLSPGLYWWRVSVIDLLGAPGKFSAPKPYRVGGSGGGEGVSKARAASEEASRIRFEVLLPPDREDFTVRVPRYRVRGRGDSGLSVTVNGEDVPMDADGNFESDVLLKEGLNHIRVVATDARGNQTETDRTMTYEP